MTFEYNGVKITWLGHDGFRFESGGETLVIDPFKLSHDARADYVLISHEHFDHCNTEDLSKVIKPGKTIVVTIPAAKDEVSKLKPKEVKYVAPGDTVHLGGFEVRAVPAYNTNKYNEQGKHFHPKQDQKVGYLIRAQNSTTIYHTGDSDHIPEMKGLAPDIALVPVSGTYVMTADEALQAVAAIKPKIAIPMHYGAIVGSKNDAEKFKRGVPANIRVEILERE